MNDPLACGQHDYSRQNFHWQWGVDQQFEPTTLQGAERITKGTFVAGSSQAFPPGTATSVFTRYDAFLQLPENVSDDFIPGTDFDISYGSTRQYVRTNGNDGTLIIAFDGDVRNQLCQRPLGLTGSPSNSRCDTDHVTHNY